MMADLSCGHLPHAQHTLMVMTLPEYEAAALHAGSMKWRGRCY